MNILLLILPTDSRIPQFPAGPAYLAAAWADNGVDVLDANVDRYTPQQVADALHDDDYDVVAVSVPGGYRPIAHADAYCRAINDSDKRGSVKLVLGGHGVAAAPEWALRRFGADLIVCGEGEYPHFEDVFAQPWQSTRITPDPVDVDALPRPAYHRFAMDVYKRCPYPRSGSRFTMAVVGGRGCPFHCTFCYRMVDGVRLRDPESVAEECAMLRRDYDVEHITFYDELFMVSAKRIHEMCKALRDKCAGMTFGVQGRLNLATRELLREMAAAGVVFVNYGIEALDDEVLRLMRKQLTVEQIHRGIQATLAEGISPGLNLIWGNLGDNIETLDRAVRFLERYDDGAQLRTIRPVTPYPGTALFAEAQRRGLLEDAEDFYRKHVNSDLIAVNLMDGITTDDAHRALYRANTRLIRNYHGRAAADATSIAWDLYCNHNADFKGWRVT